MIPTSHVSAETAPAAAGGVCRHPKVEQIVAYWRGLAPGPGVLPGRQHLDPMRIPALLPNIWLLDVVAGRPTRFRYRLIGTRLVEAGIPGRPGGFLDEAPETDSLAVQRLFESVVAGREPNWSIGAPLLKHSTQVTRIERVSMPLAADGHTVDMVLSLTLFYRTDGSVR